MTRPTEPTGRDPEQVLDTLLASMANDAPCPEARRKASLALGLGAAAVTTGVTANAATSLLTLVTKAVAIGAVAGVVTVGAVSVFDAPGVFRLGSPVSAPARSRIPARPGAGLAPARTRTPESQAPTLVPSSYAATPASSPPSAARTEKDLLEEGAQARAPVLRSAPEATGIEERWPAAPSLAEPLPATAHTVREWPDGVTRSQAPLPEPTRVEEPFPAKRLRDETAALERASSALSGGDLALAIAEIDAYEAAFPSGILKPEASFLRIEVLVRMGDGARARAAADAFRSRYPQSPHLARLRTLLASDQKPSLTP